jgi:phospholipase/lecithinase/hemolysin
MLVVSALKKLAVSATLLVCALSPLDAFADAAPIKRVVAFGDSLTDCGTFGMLFSTNPSLGFAQIVAAKYGHELGPNRKVQVFNGTDFVVNPPGLCYAEGGSRVAERRSDKHTRDQAPLPFTVQVENFQQQHRQFSPNDLVIVFIGGNDVVTPFRSPEFADVLVSGEGITDAMWTKMHDHMKTYAMQEVDTVRKLRSLGAERILVLNNMDYGKAPFQEKWSDAAAKNTDNLVRAYNEALAANLHKEPAVVLVDTYNFFEDLIANHQKYSFKTATADACKPELVYCFPKDYAESNSNETYVFGGYGHFTAKTHRLLADFVLKQVATAWPEAKAE